MLSWGGAGLAGEVERGVSNGRMYQDPVEEDGVGEGDFWLGG